MRIGFAWELGVGTGHFAPYAELIAALVAAGHSIEFFAQKPVLVCQALGDLPVAVHPAVFEHSPVEARLARPLSLADVLWNCGFHRADALRSRLLHWCTQLRDRSLDVLVCDHAPTALLAAHVLKLRAIVAGSGYMLPPRAAPLPRFRWWEAPNHAEQQTREATLLGNINEATLDLGGTPLAAVCDLVCPEAQLLLAFEELDHYLERGPAQYLGTFPAATAGEPPSWPSGPGPRVFAYLNPQINLKEILEPILARGARVCAYLPGLDDRSRAGIRHPRLTLLPAPANLRQVAAGADWFLSNANYNSICHLLLLGVPQLMVSYDLEKYMIGRRVEMLGAGLLVPRTRLAQLGAAAELLSTQRDYRRAARHFAGRYANIDASISIAKMTAVITESSPPKRQYT